MDAVGSRKVSEDIVNNETSFGVFDDIIPGLPWIGTAEGCCEHLGRHWFEYVRVDLQHAIGNPIFHFIHAEDEAMGRRTWQQAIKSGEIFELELRLRRHDGVFRWHRVRGAPDRGRENEVKRWAVACVDIEEQKTADERLPAMHGALARVNEELENKVVMRTQQLQEAVEQLETFAYSIAHDMRAPLRTMHQYAEMVARDFAGHVPLEARGYLNKIMGASEKLDCLIREVLVYTRVSQGRMILKSQSLDRLLSEILIGHPSLSGPEVALNARLPLHPVIGDHTALTQAFSHLLTNAVKFVPAGRKPTVTIWTEEIGDKVRISFRDNGIGIPAGDRERIFKMFERLQPESKHAGSGIGLTIVRRAVERMGGSLGVDSVEGEGSTFWIDLKKGEAC